MPNISQQKNIGAYIAAARGFANTSVTAGGAGDNVEITGDSVRKRQAKSASLLIPYTATLADTESFTLLTKIQESSNGSAWDTAETIQTATTIVTSDGGTTETGCHKVDIDFSGRKEYVRALVTPDMSATATDTMALSGAWVFAGDDVVTAAPADLTT